jgi:hypothetical protein
MAWTATLTADGNLTLAEPGGDPTVWEIGTAGDVDKLMKPAAKALKAAGWELGEWWAEGGAGKCEVTPP